jgi:addiction module HigA family antidote
MKKPDKYAPAPPIKPGEVLRRQILGSKITQEQLAKGMRVSRFSINQIINGRRSITAEMAIRLGHVTSTTPDFWLNLQRAVDLYEAEQKLIPVIDKLTVLRPPKSEIDLFLDAKSS